MFGAAPSKGSHERNEYGWDDDDVHDGRRGVCASHPRVRHRADGLAGKDAPRIAAHRSGRNNGSALSPEIKVPVTE